MTTKQHEKLFGVLSKFAECADFEIESVHHPAANGTVDTGSADVNKVTVVLSIDLSWAEDPKTPLYRSIPE